MHLVTKSTANRQLSGNRAQMNATFRHGNTSPQPNTIKIPKLYDNNAIVLIIPRILGSLQAEKCEINDEKSRLNLKIGPSLPDFADISAKIGKKSIFSFFQELNNYVRNRR